MEKIKQLIIKILEEVNQQEEEVNQENDNPSRVQK